MSQNDTKTPKVEADIELVAKISAKDEKAWEMFVEQHTDWVLYKAKEWCMGHCGYTASSYSCGLASLSVQRDGRKFFSDAPECDEGLDTYIWIIERLQKKIVKYTGKNNCMLSTFVWTILNSRELHIDWLRWKYGRAF